MKLEAAADAETPRKRVCVEISCCVDLFRNQHTDLPSVNKPQYARFLCSIAVNWDYIVGILRLLVI